MTEPKPIQGELQSQIMPALWRLGEATVEQVREELAPGWRGAYNTIQTVLNRLAERGLLDRERHGHQIIYRPHLTEAEYLSESIDRTLAAASPQARQAVLAQLVGALDPDELTRLRRVARRISRPGK